MAYSKVILNGTTLMDVTQKTVAADKMLTGYTALKNDGTDITGSYTPPSFSTQSKTVSPSTSQQTVTADGGYDGLSSVTVNAISPTKAAQTYTPGTSNQTISSGRWLTGAQTILGDANLVAGNIKSGTTIFGVTGTYSGGGGGLPGWTDITSAFTLDGSYDYFQALYRAQSDTVVFFGQCGIDGSAPSVSTITPSGNYVPDVATLYAMDAGMQPMGTITAVNLHVSTSTVYDFFPFTEDLVWDLTQNSTPLDDTPDVCFYCMYIVNA